RRWAGDSADDDPVRWQLRAFADDSTAHAWLTEKLLDSNLQFAQRADLLATVAVTHPAAIGAAAEQWLGDLESGRAVDEAWRDALLSAVVQRAAPDIQRIVLQRLANVPIGVQAKVASLMVQLEPSAM